MSTEKINYWQPRVMRHLSHEGNEEFAIHEVYFSEDGRVITYTEDALSPRESTVSSLRTTLISFLMQDATMVKCGDLNYTYSKEAIQEWLKYTDYQPIDYEQQNK